MPIGESAYGGGSQQRKNQDFTYYSRFNLKNAESKALGATFWAGMLQITIDVKENTDSSFARYVTTNKINLSPMKARILYAQIEEFEKYVASAKTIDENKAFGVNAGLGETVDFIALHANKEKTPIVTIGKFDNNGTIIEKNDFVFSKEYHYGLDWSNLDSNALDKHFYEDKELESFKDLVGNFAHNIDGSIAYSVMDIARYDTRRNTDRIEQIMGKLGLEVFRPQNRGTNDFLQGGSKSGSATGSVSHSIDDIMN